MSLKNVIKSDIYEAISEIEYIQTILDSSRRVSQGTPRIEIKMMIALLAVSGGFLIYELFLGASITNGIMMSKNIPDVQHIGLVQILTALFVVGGGLYYIAWRRAHELESTLRRTLNRNFQSLELGRILPGFMIYAGHASVRLALASFGLALLASIAYMTSLLKTDSAEGARQ